MMECCPKCLQPFLIPVERKKSGEHMILEIPRFCNSCGKKFTYRIVDMELWQQKQSIDYICQDCDDNRKPPVFHQVGSYNRLDQIWEERNNGTD